MALHLLFGVPLWLGGAIVGVVTLGALHWLRRRGEAVFQTVVMAVLLVLSAGFLAGLYWSPPSASGVLGGLVPRFDGLSSVVLAAAILGATVMPHAIYVHSTLAADRHAGRSVADLPRLLRVQRWDVVLALVVAGSVNLSMVLVAASSLQGRAGTDTITGAHDLLRQTLGALPATIFAVALLLSGLSSSLVSTHAGARIFRDLRVRRTSPLVRRLVTIAPAVLLLLVFDNPTQVLVWSQLVLSFGIAFALVPLMQATGSVALMGDHRPGVAMRVAGWAGVVLVVVLNVALLAAAALG